MNSLPEGVLLHLLQSFSGHELLIISSVSRAFHKGSLRPSLWTFLSRWKFTVQGCEEWGRVMQHFEEYERIRFRRKAKRPLEATDISLLLQLLQKPKLRGVKATEKLYDAPLWKRFYFERPFHFEHQLDLSNPHFTFKREYLSFSESRHAVETRCQARIVVESRTDPAMSACGCSGASSTCSSSSASSSSSTSWYVVVWGFYLAQFLDAVSWVREIVASNYEPSGEALYDAFMSSLAKS